MPDSTSPVSSSADVPIEPLLAEAWSLYRRHFWVFVRLILVFAGAAIIALLPVILYAGSTFLTNLLSGRGNLEMFFVNQLSQGNVPYLFFILSAISILALIIIYSLLVASLYQYLIAATGSKPVRWPTAVALAWPLVGSFVWLSFLQGLVIILGLILLIIPGLIFLVRYGLADYALFVEGRRGISALRRSRELTTGWWWPAALIIYGSLVVWSILGIIPLVGLILTYLYLPLLVAIQLKLYQRLITLKDQRLVWRRRRSTIFLVIVILVIWAASLGLSIQREPNRPATLEVPQLPSQQ